MMRHVRNLFHLGTIILSVILLTGILNAATSPNSQAKVRLQQPAIYFTENRGQWDERVLYKADGGAGLTWWFERDGLTLAVVVPDTTAPLPARDNPLPARRGWQDERSVGFGEPTPDTSPRKGHALKLRFVPSPEVGEWDRASRPVSNPQSGTSCATEVIPDGKLLWNNNYFLGNDSTKWAPDCGNFTRLTYRNVWDGIDVVYYGEGNQLKYDYVVKPGADPSNVRLRWLGLEKPLAVIPAQVGIQSNNSSSLIPAEAGIQSSSELLLATSVGTLREGIPLAYQRGEDGARQPVEVSMRVLSENEFGLEVVGDWDRSKELVVDPLVWSTYLGGQNNDFTSAIASCEDGSVIAIGRTASSRFPVTEGALDLDYNDGQNQENSGSSYSYWDMTASKFNSDGSSLVFSTFIGGDRYESGFDGINIEEGGIFLIGATRSQNVPVTNDAISARLIGNGNTYIVRLNPDGNRILYASYFGIDNEGHEIERDSNGYIYIGGYPWGETFPTTENAYDTVCEGGQSNMFIAKLNCRGNEVLYCTLFGQEDYCSMRSLCVDESGCVIISGVTNEDELPVSENAIDRTFNGEYDAFVTKFSPLGDSLIFCTYLGGSQSDQANSVDVHYNGSILIAGNSESSDFPMIEGGFDSEYHGEFIGWVYKINDFGTEIIFGTFLGGGVSHIKTCMYSFDEKVIVAGQTGPGNFPLTEDALDNEFGNGDGDEAFITVFNEEMSNILFSTYWGGNGHEEVFDLTLDQNGGVVLCGYTNSENFPLSDRALDNEISGLEGYVARFALQLPYFYWVDLPDTIQVDENVWVEFEVRSASGNIGHELTITYRSDDIPNLNQFEDNGDGTGSFLWQTTFEDAGEYLATFTLSDGESEISADVVIIVNNVNRAPEWVLMPDSVSVNEGETLRFPFRAADPDNDMFQIRLSSPNLPEPYFWEASDSGWGGTHEFVFPTNFEYAGDYQALFTVSDRTDSTEAVVNIHVNDVNSVSNFIPHPTSFILSSPFPNPFNSSATIRFGLPVSGEASLRVTDTNGRLMATLVEGRLEAGWHEVVWDAVAFPAGVYLVELNAGEQKLLQKVVLTR